MTKNQGQWLKVFCPDARCLDDVEVAALPEETKDKASDKEGLWLEVFCPDESCLTEGEGAFTIKDHDEGMWLSLFCPEGSCQISEESQAV